MADGSRYWQIVENNGSVSRRDKCEKGTPAELISERNLKPSNDLRHFLNVLNNKFGRFVGRISGDGDENPFERGSFKEPL